METHASLRWLRLVPGQHAEEAVAQVLPLQVRRREAAPLVDVHGHHRVPEGAELLALDDRGPVGLPTAIRPHKVFWAVDLHHDALAREHNVGGVPPGVAQYDVLLAKQWRVRRCLKGRGTLGAIPQQLQSGCRGPRARFGGGYRRFEMRLRLVLGNGRHLPPLLKFLMNQRRWPNRVPSQGTPQRSPLGPPQQGSSQ